MAAVNTIVITGYGTNSHVETAHTARLAGADRVDIVHFSDLVAGDVFLDDYRFLIFPGGFLDGDDLDLLSRVKDVINAKQRVGCTGCRYCMPCPQGVDIPGAFSAFNRAGYDGYFRGLRDYFMCAALRTNRAAVSQCIGCGKCEHCPQSIEIRQELKRVKKYFETPLYKVAVKVAPKFVKY